MWSQENTCNGILSGWRSKQSLLYSTESPEIIPTNSEDYENYEKEYKL
jgi:hypothetical protein